MWPRSYDDFEYHNLVREEAYQPAVAQLASALVQHFHNCIVDGKKVPC